MHSTRGVHFMRKTFIEKLNGAWHFPRRHFLRLEGSSRTFTSSKKSLVTLTKGAPCLPPTPSHRFSLSRCIYHTLKWFTSLLHIYVYLCHANTSCEDRDTSVLFAAVFLYPEQGQTQGRGSINKRWMNVRACLVFSYENWLLRRRKRGKSKEFKPLQRRKTYSLVVKHTVIYLLCTSPVPSSVTNPQHGASHLILTSAL